MKRNLSLILLLILVVVSLIFAGINGFSGSSPTTSPPQSEKQPQVSEVLDIVTEYYEAVNAGDVEYLGELFADDIIIDYPRVDFYGKEDALKMYENMASRNTQVTGSEAVVEGDVFRSKHSVINEAGDELTGDIIIGVRGDKIYKISVVWDEESMEKIESQGPPAGVAEPPPSDETPQITETPQTGETSQTEETPQASLAEVEIPVENVDAIIDAIYFEPETTGKQAVGRLDWRNIGDATHDFDLNFYMVTPEDTRHGPVQVNNDVQSEPWVTNNTALQLSFEELPAGTYGVAADICDAQTGEVVTSRTFSDILSLVAPPEETPSLPAGLTGTATTGTAPSQYTLQTGVNPPGSGTVSHRSGAYNSGNILNLTATPAQGYQFVSWSGDVQNTNNQITITMNRDYALQANFELVPSPEPTPAQFVLQTEVAPPEGGTVNPDSGTYPGGTEIILTAAPAEGYKFVSWSGDIRGTSDRIVIGMNRNYNLQANFTLILGPPVVVEIPDEVPPVLPGPEPVKVIPPPVPLPPAAPSNLNAQTISSSSIRLTWTDNSKDEVGFKIERSISRTGGFSVTNTIGADVTSFDDLRLNAGTSYFYRVKSYNKAGDSAPSNTAGATPLQRKPSTYTLKVTTSGTGSGLVTGQGINCGTDCYEEYPAGTSVTLTATADSGSAFSSWSGCDEIGDNTCVVVMNQDRSVTATFTLVFTRPVKIIDKTIPQPLK